MSGKRRLQCTLAVVVAGVLAGSAAGSSANFREVDLDDLPPNTSQQTLDQYAVDNANLLNHLADQQEATYDAVIELLFKRRAELKSERLKIPGVSRNEDGDWEIEYPQNDIGRARLARLKEITAELGRLSRDINKANSLVLEDIRKRTENLNKGNEATKKAVEKIKKDLQDIKQGIDSLAKKVAGQEQTNAEGEVSQEEVNAVSAQIDEFSGNVKAALDAVASAGKT